MCIRGRVAHPGLVPIALEIFNRAMPAPHQRDRLRRDIQVSAEDLLRVPTGSITEAGLRVNVNVGLRYLESWLRGTEWGRMFARYQRLNLADAAAGLGNQESLQRDQILTDRSSE